MQKQILATEPIHRRAEILRDTCYKVLENEHYTRKLEPDEVIECKTELYQKDMEVEDLKAQLKDATAVLRKKIKELNERRSELIRTIQFESVSQRGTVFLMDEQESNLMFIYDVNGYCVGTRPLLPEEKQTSILTIKRNGTDY